MRPAAGLDAPVLAHQRGDEIQPVGPVIPLAAQPRASEVLDLHPDVVAEQLGPDGEGLPGRAAVQDRVGGQLAGDQHRVIGPRAASQVGPQPGADPADLAGLSVERARVSNRRLAG